MEKAQRSIGRSESNRTLDSSSRVEKDESVTPVGSNASETSIPSTSVTILNEDNLSSNTSTSIPIKVPPEATTSSSVSALPDCNSLSSTQDLERGRASNDSPTSAAPLDIEHLTVVDDPRLWSRTRKSCILAVIAYAAMGGTISANIFFPAIADLQRDLDASNELIAASVSLFILFQGITPILWSGVSEIKGRRTSYLASFVIFCVATTVCSQAHTISVFLVMRVIQAVGASAVLSLGAGTLSDIYDVHERGTKLGIYYAAPLLGPSLGPLIGGVLTSVSSWRSTFYFLLAFGVSCLVLLIWLPETFRKERSLAYRLAIERARAHAKEDLLKSQAQGIPGTKVEEKKVNEKIGKPTTFVGMEKSTVLERTLSAGVGPVLSRIRTALGTGGDDDVKISLRDLNPLAAVGTVLRQKQNVLAVLYSGLLFASQYSISFTASQTFARAPYNFGPLFIGLVLLSFGVGNMIGSVAGGWFSDRVFNKLKEKNGGVGQPEMRIRSTRIAMIAMPPFFIAYAWVVQKLVPIYWPIMILFVLGLATVWIYSSTLTYIVDANPGKASSAVACNSLFRGILAAVASQISEPLIGKIGNGWYYTGFALILLGGEIGLCFVMLKGQGWREGYREAEEKKVMEDKIKSEGLTDTVEEKKTDVRSKFRLPWS